MAAETAAQRYTRDYGNMTTSRRTRELDKQTLERVRRLYVASDGSTPADDNNSH